MVNPRGDWWNWIGWMLFLALYFPKPAHWLHLLARKRCEEPALICLKYNSGGEVILIVKEPGTDVKAFKCYSLEIKWYKGRNIPIIFFLTYNGIILSPPRETITSSSTSASNILNVPRMDLLYSPIPSPRLDRHEMKEIKKGRRKQRH